MPHRPNPIPRYNGSNLPPQSHLHPISNETTPTGPNTRREKDPLAPRHRASSWAASHERPLSATTTSSSVSGTSTPTVTGANATGGGRPSGRALPPPRFQRKQRPPRVQQALASSSSNSASTSQSGSRRGTGGGANNVSATPHGRTGTLTLGPANNWGAGTSAVVSLSMATINAASARASVVHPPAHSIPSFEYDAQDARPLDPQSYDLDGLDPVQLHNRITFGMGRTSNAIRNDLYASDYIQHPNYSVLPSLTPDLDSYSSLSSGRDPDATLRARSQSQHAAHAPSLYHPSNTRAYSPSSPYASSFGLETPPMLHATPPRPIPDFDHQLRIRSQSLMAPVDAHRLLRESSGLIPPIPAHSAFSPRIPSFDPVPVMPIPSHLSLDTEFDTMRPQIPSSPPHSASSTKKPLKSALKNRKSSPELGGASLPVQAIPPLPRQEYAPQAPRVLPDPEFTLPDDSLQAQYAHQLLLLQEEYANKAAKAERSRQRSVERAKATSSKRPIEDVPMPVAESTDRQAALPRGRPVDLETPPSSGQRVAFFEEVQVIGQNKDGVRPTSEEQDAGYLSWDEGWTGDEEEFVYAPSGNAEKTALERREGDTDDSLATDTSDFDGGSDVGDRGHDDAPHERAALLGPESPTTQRVLQDTAMSPVELEVSPVNAIIHGHEPSPVAETSHGGNHDGNALTEPEGPFSSSSLPMVEVIAPTPVIASKELEISEDLPRFDEMDKGDGFTNEVGQVKPVSSTESTESSDSNSTLRTSALDPVVPEGVVADEQPVAEAFSTLDQGRDSFIQDVPAEWKEQAPVPQLPRTLQRLAHRISRGTAVPLPSARSPPTIAPPPISVLPFGDYHAAGLSTYQETLSPSLDYQLDDDESLRRISSITSLSSASSGLHGTIFPRPPQSFAGTTSLEQDVLHGRPSPRSRTDPTPHGHYNQVPSRQTTAPSIPFPAVPMTRQNPPEGSIPYAQSRRISRQSAIGEYSSAASVESGSSHGGGTSGASHVQRARGRSVAGSTLSTSSSGSHHRNLRAPPGQPPPPAFGSNVLSTSNSSPGMESLLSHASSEHQWDKGLLSGARSSESLGALSAASGRSGGSTGSGKSAGRALGGESIWTLGKEEATNWPAAPPSSSGHSSQSKDLNQFMLHSLVPPVEPPPEVPRVRVASREKVPLRPEPDYSYEAHLPGDALDSYYGGHTSYALAPGPDRSRPHQPISQSRSAPSLPVFEQAPVVRGRGEYRQSNVPQNISRYQEESHVPPHLRSKPASFNPEIRYSSDPRLAPQASSRSLPTQAPPEQSQRNVFDTGGYSATSSRPSTARSALYVGPGAGDADQYARKSMMALPATGGVFPRYQEVSGPYADVSVRPGSSGGRFKSLFKSRDSRVFK